MSIRETIGAIPVLAAANPATLASLMPHIVVRRWKKGGHLFLDKETVTQVFFLAEGVCCLYKLGASEEKQGIFIYGPGSMINEVILDERPASINCQLLTDARVLSMDRRQLLFACEQDFALSKAVMDSMALKIRRLYHQMKNTANTVRGDRRIAAKPWKLSRDFGVPCAGGTKIGIELTITFLAELLGSKRETVSRQVAVLADAGLISVAKRHFIIRDRDRLLQYFTQS